MEFKNVNRIVYVSRLLILLFPALFQPGMAQDTSHINQNLDLIKIFIDSPDWYMDLDYYRKEIPYVNYMRDRADADVHILTTSQVTGGGGREFTINFIGRNEFVDQKTVLKYISNQTDTEDIIRKELARYFKIGLMQFIYRSHVIDHIDILYNKPDSDQTLAKPTEDPWDYWTFKTTVSGYFDGEKTYKYSSLNASFSVKRVTEEWRHDFYYSTNQSKTVYDYPGEKPYTDHRRSNYFDGYSIKSLTPHWSAGVRAIASNSTYNNFDLSLSFLTGVEYNIFPYSESTSRQFTFQYILGAHYYDYHKETIYLLTSEKRFSEKLNIEYQIKQPWGSISTSLSGSHYMHDVEKFNIQLNNSLEIQLIRGFSLEIWGYMTFLRDQLSLPKEEASFEEVLLRRREIETSYYYYVSVGLSYSFGSIYNNIVNPRFGG